MPEAQQNFGGTGSVIGDMAVKGVFGLQGPITSGPSANAGQGASRVGYALGAFVNDAALIAKLSASVPLAAAEISGAVTAGTTVGVINIPYSDFIARNVAAVGAVQDAVDAGIKAASSRGTIEGGAVGGRRSRS